MADETQDPEAPRDERHDSVDPTTGTLTVEAIHLRGVVIGRLQSWGHAIHSWADALAHPHFEAAMAGEDKPEDGEPDRPEYGPEPEPAPPAVFTDADTNHPDSKILDDPLPGTPAGLLS